MTATNFRKAYGVLQKHADTLRNQQEPNIDDLLHIVTESVAAYKVCKERIDAVERALEQALGGAGAGAEGGSDRPAEPAPDLSVPADKRRLAGDPEDGDVPF